ncbi:MMPL family transporter [Kitasatospora phosalacinea]|uniref:Membrane protein n=1 Tax=Kitasatospora phosalacinea TaxID=2065 RepID=A0A9W6PCD2_9ACTN|nr:MMPL family transporter [Kitasatospora phosalacinea]GLW52367.1 putative membrane protein [Kitasatospora phosalacinea]
MFHRLGHFVVKRAWWVIIAWVVASFALVSFAPKLSATTDEADFLPKHYESIRAAALQEEKFPAEFTPGAILLFERTDGGALTDTDKADMAKVTQGLTDKHVKLVEQIIPPSDKSTSKDGHYAMSMVSIDKTKMQTDEYGEAAKGLRTEGKKLTEGTALKFQVGGQAAMALDQKESSSATDMITMLATVVLIVVIVGAIFRGVLVGWLPVLLSLLPMIAASGLISFVTDIFDLKSSPIASAIQIVVILGVGTDYFLFLMFRYRERLRAGDDRKSAVANGVGRVGEAIASAAGAVTVAFAVLILSELGMFTALGPALAISVIVTALASLTLTPALLAVIPAKATFWPGRKWMEEPTGARFHKLGRTVGRRPGLVAVLSGGLLLVLSLAGLGYQGTFDMAKSMMPKDKESMVVMDSLSKGFSAGAADPTHVFLSTADKGGAKLDAAALDGFGAKLGQVSGVATVAPDHKVSEDGTTADFVVTLKDAAASNEAIDSVTELRSTAHAAAPGGSEALIGGTSSIYKDINLAMTHDYKLVFPVAGLLILLILGLQLRSVVAPWYLMASVGLGFAATLGATTVAFLKIGSEPGLMFMLPIFIYLFVVAIGTDYNILIIARLREEAREGRSPRKAAEEALRHAGPTVAAAGFILAASFATFMLAGNVLFAELGFALAIGIALAAFVMAMFFTPSITALLGKKAWWPGHGAMPDHGPESIGEREPEPAGRVRS